MMQGLPPLALSVRQPWAWAILHAGKEIENRSWGAIRSGGMAPGRICLHAATGMTAREYDWGAWRLQGHGVRAPRPDELVRGAIIGTVEVTAIVDRSDSPWFGGPAGLVLARPQPIAPIPARGALGYFRWQPGGSVARPVPWMRAHGEAPLFTELPLSFATPPSRPRPR
jgi:hypothetical protein